MQCCQNKLHVISVSFSIADIISADAKNILYSINRLVLELSDCNVTLLIALHAFKSVGCHVMRSHYLRCATRAKSDDLCFVSFLSFIIIFGINDASNE